MNMKRILLVSFGLPALALSACAGSATPTRLAVELATETFTPLAETATQPAPTDTAIPAMGTSAPTTAPAIEVSFSNDVMPILNNSCTKRHGVEEIKKGLDMTSYAKLMAGSFNGPVIVAGDANQSKLIDMLIQGKMPKRGDKLTPEQIQVIINWINAGALNN